MEKVASTSNLTDEVVVQKVDIEALMAMGDVVSGEKIFKKCEKFNSHE